MTSPSPLPVKPLARQKSEEAFAKAQTLMPGGVNSPVRSFRSVGGGTPLIIKRSEGAYLYDIDDHCYIDYVGSWGPAILGHTHPEVVKRVCETAQNGLSFGCPTVHENALAEAVIVAVPGIERVRFVSSGTEAVMSAIRLARAYTGREKIIKFTGCYHGHADYLLVKAGSGALSLGVPDSEGVTVATAKDTLTARFNDLESVKNLLEANVGQVAGVIVEPVAGNMGCVPPKPQFLQGLRELCDEFGSLLLFDEVMTGFRVAYGGAQALYNVTPDITMLGKIVGGGMPVGAYGASEAIMKTVAPLGPMYQAGTLSGNPLGMVSGFETLRLLQAHGVYQQLEERSAQLAEGLRVLCEAKNIPHTVHQVGPMLSLFFKNGPVDCFEDVMQADRAFFNRFFWAMLNRGVYLAPSAFEAWFVSLAHTTEIINKTLEAADASLDEALAGSSIL